MHRARGAARCVLDPRENEKNDEVWIWILENHLKIFRTAKIALDRVRQS